MTSNVELNAILNNNYINNYYNYLNNYSIYLNSFICRKCQVFTYCKCKQVLTELSEATLFIYVKTH